MLKKLLLPLIMVIMAYPAVISRAQGPEDAKRILVIREAKEDPEAAVAVEGVLEEDIFKVRVTVRIERATPNIYSMLLVGPNIGRMSPDSIKSLYATLEKEEPYSTKRRGAFISFGDDAKSKQLKGRVSRKLAEYRIPADKIKPDGDYQLWIRVESSKQRGRIATYRFDLENFPQLVQKSVQ